MKTILFSFILLFVGLQMEAKPVIVCKKGKTEEATIQTSGTCEECKYIIEAALKKTKGVKKSNYDLETKAVTVTFSPKKTDLKKIKMAIVKSGYDADEMKADQEAYDNLPKCCKKGGMDE